MHEFKLLESKMHPGYYHIPEFPDFVITRDGRVKHELSGTDLVEKKGKYRYYNLVFYPSQPTHRLLGLTFIPRVKGKHLVNHIDGNKWNNALSNLEWATYSDNINHAFDTGLRTDIRPVTVFDTINDHIEKCRSVNRAAKWLKVNPGTLHTYLHSIRNALFLNRYVVIWEDSEDLDERRAAIVRDHRNGALKPVMVENLNTGEKTVYASAGIAARALGWKEPITYYRLTQAKKPYKGIKLTYVDGIPDGDMVHESREKYLPIRQPVPILVTDTKTGKVSNWPSVKEFAKHHGSNRDAVAKRIHVRGGWKHYKITYLTSSNNPVPTIRNGG